MTETEIRAIVRSEIRRMVDPNSPRASRQIERPPCPVTTWVRSLPPGTEGLSRELLPLFLAATGEHAAAWPGQSFAERLKAMRKAGELECAGRLNNATRWRVPTRAAS